MSKHIYTISVREEIMLNYRQLVGRGNVSNKLEDYMESAVNAAKTDSSMISLQLLKAEYESDLAAHTALSNKMLALRQQIDEVTKAKAEMEQKRLLEEKERIEKLQSCINCGNPLGEKSHKHKFGKGFVCGSCFLSADAASVKRWSE